MRRWLLVVCLLLLPLRSSAGPLDEIGNAIIELDVQRAQDLLVRYADASGSAMHRARLAIYRGDCDAAAAILSAPSLASTKEGASLRDLAERCARATAGSLIIEDEKQGIWIRLQDDRDEPLVPRIVRAAVRARASMQRDLGVDLPRPLRIDLVRDLFSLSALTGLRVEAAETTGTVAVARWGRVTMITPRATTRGFPWEDTLAHEVTHLALSRATRDRAPLWLQEGIAKRQETRWRKARPFDDKRSFDRVAYEAMKQGRSVGVDKIGPSIAMLPTPEAASIAFAEVTSFISYWIEENGEPALHLFLKDLKATDTSDPDLAMRSVTGYPLGYWIARWQQDLEGRASELQQESQAERERQGDPRVLARFIRLGDLLQRQRYHEQAADSYQAALDQAPMLAALRWRKARAEVDQPPSEEALAGQAPTPRARGLESLGSLTDLDAAHGAWFALHGRLLLEDQPVHTDQLAHTDQADVAEEHFNIAASLDPLSVEVACRGYGGANEQEKWPKAPEWRALCEAARAIVSD